MVSLVFEHAQSYRYVSFFCFLGMNEYLIEKNLNLCLNDLVNIINL